MGVIDYSRHIDIKVLVGNERDFFNVYYYVGGDRDIIITKYRYLYHYFALGRLTNYVVKYFCRRERRFIYPIAVCELCRRVVEPFDIEYIGHNEGYMRFHHIHPLGFVILKMNNKKFRDVDSEELREYIVGEVAELWINKEVDYDTIKRLLNDVILRQNL